MELVRLNKYLAGLGVCSRREADKLIMEGLIKLNDRVIGELGIKIDPSRDQVKVDDKVFEMREKLVYIMLNKPKGYVTTCKKTLVEDKIVLDLLKIKERVYPVGRLDKDSKGLLILTNDGLLSYKLTHPSHECEKEYLVITNKKIPDGALKKLVAGVKLWGEKTKETEIKRVGENSFTIILREGKNRQIRRIVRKVGYFVVDLKRFRIGKLLLGNLKEGEYRFLKKEEVSDLSLT